MRLITEASRIKKVRPPRRKIKKKRAIRTKKSQRNRMGIKATHRAENSQPSIFLDLPLREKKPSRFQPVTIKGIGDVECNVPYMWRFL